MDLKRSIIPGSKWSFGACSSDSFLSSLERIIEQKNMWFRYFLFDYPCCWSNDRQSSPSWFETGRSWSIRVALYHSFARRKMKAWWMTPGMWRQGQGDPNDPRSACGNGELAGKHISWYLQLQDAPKLTASLAGHVLLVASLLQWPNAWNSMTFLGKSCQNLHFQTTYQTHWGHANISFVDCLS